MIASMRAELMRLARWPVTWVLSGTWLALNLTFGYLFTYLSYRSESGGGSVGGMAGAAPAAVLLAELMPDRAPVTAVQGMPLFGGALVLILGAVAVGGGYGWGTWKTVFTAGPTRPTALGGTLAALGVVLVGLTVATFGVDLAASLAVAALESQPVTWPTLADVAQGFGAALLIGGAWLAGGVLLGTLTRGPALAVGLGLVWTLVVENLLRGVAALLGPVEAVTKLLPGTAAGALAGALGALSEGEPSGTPGVNSLISAPVAVALLAGYLLVFLAATVALTTRRDVTS